MMSRMGNTSHGVVTRTWNPSALGPHFGLTGANLIATITSTGATNGNAVLATQALSGTGSLAVTCGGTGANGWLMGICDGAISLSNFTGFDTHGIAFYSLAAVVAYNSGSVSGATGVTWSSGDTVNVQYDVPGQQMRAQVNGGTFTPWTSWAGKIGSPVYFGASTYNVLDSLTLIP